jgi:DDE superfamily endonuclease
MARRVDRRRLPGHDDFCGRSPRVKEPARPFSHLPAFLAGAVAEPAHWLDHRSALRLPQLLLGIRFAKGRRTVTAWFRAAGIGADYRQGYVTVAAAGREARRLALTVQAAVRPLLNPRRLLVAIDDTPTARDGPWVQGAGIHHNPRPGPAGAKHVDGHVGVVLAALATHAAWGTIALPLQAELSIRARDLAKLPPALARPFRTKRQRAVGQWRWLKPRIDGDFEQRWVVVDGGDAKRAFLGPAQADGWVVVRRRRKDAHLGDLPPTRRRPGQRGPLPT